MYLITANMKIRRKIVPTVWSFCLIMVGSAYDLGGAQSLRA